jgi:Rieske Fe-S protein
VLRLAVVASVGVACGEDDGRRSSSGNDGDGGAGGAGGGMGGGLPQNFELVGHIESLPVGTVLELIGYELFIGRDAGGVYVMSSRCTHQGCNMLGNDGIVAPGLIRCGCHNSEFDANGVATRGPAVATLQHFAVAVDAEGNVGVDPTLAVGPEVRAPVA